MPVHRNLYLVFACAIVLLALPRWTLAGDKAESYCNRRKFEIPVRVASTRRPEIRELVLYLSRNEGKSWERVSEIAPDRSAFPFASTSDGSHWFIVQTVYRNGQLEPQKVQGASAGLKVCVDTTPPVIRLRSCARSRDPAGVS